ncbi:comF family protein [Desulfonispora thiosulfatigenes DSM 11270]|uniref:ComF family protein n=1 Tax=Desulfonispora thiosulfatigenes DSM 11270 TaxID=656914 RepID=A0A1W1UYB2_DESTI|nr:ComF family protein [Desulfonispora thiosulfatigenes]SMB85754.1 comF family protein [Desulfonispora thiosulfatigenes DSM 11270]
MIAHLLELLFPTPRICPLCGNKQEHLKICNSCLHKIDDLQNVYGKCLKCGTYGHSGENCENCFYWPEYIQENIAMVPFENEYRKLLHKFKFQKQGWLADAMIPLMADQVKRRKIKIDLIMPVPLHIKRVRERGFNQAALLASKIARELQVTYDEKILIRKKNTSHQTGKNQRKRSTNLKDAFIVLNEESINNKNILIIDDVITSGATLRECSKVLVQKGAKGIYGLTWASGINEDSLEG